MEDGGGLENMAAAVRERQCGLSYAAGSSSYIFRRRKLMLDGFQDALRRRGAGVVAVVECRRGSVCDSVSAFAFSLLGSALARSDTCGRQKSP